MGSRAIWNRISTFGWKKIGGSIAAAVVFLATVYVAFGPTREANLREARNQEATVQELVMEAIYFLEGDGADAFYISCDMNLDRHKKLVQARAILENALIRSPENVEAIDAMGSTYLTECNWRNAEGYLRRCAVLAPNRAQCHLKLGLSLEKQGRQNYEYHYQEALRLDPEDSDLRIAIASYSDSQLFLLDTIRRDPQRLKLRLEGGKEVVDAQLGSGSTDRTIDAIDAIPELQEATCSLGSLADLMELKLQALPNGEELPPEIIKKRREIQSQIIELKKELNEIGCGEPA